MARQTRRYDRHRASAAPDHPKPLLEQRTKAREHQGFRRFLARAPRAEPSDLKLEERRRHPPQPGRNIVALSDLSAPEAVARALEDACVDEACSSDSMAHLVEQRARCTPEARALQLTRRRDLLDGSRAPPALSMDPAPPQPPSPDTVEDRPPG